MNTTGQVRIIGGKLRKRVLRFPSCAGLRPTPDRVRETLFNWLGQDLTGLTCLDLFAGSGALGIEAASRGAKRVVLVEENTHIARALRSNLIGLPTTQIEVQRTDALSYAIAVSSSKRSPAYDLLFLDPPFGQHWLRTLEPYLKNLLKSNGILYVEAETPLSELSDWQCYKSGHTMQVYYHLMRRNTERG